MRNGGKRAAVRWPGGRAAPSGLRGGGAVAVRGRHLQLAAVPLDQPLIGEGERHADAHLPSRGHQGVIKGLSMGNQWGNRWGHQGIGGISAGEQMAPHLLADESLTMGSPVASKSAARA